MNLIDMSTDGWTQQEVIEFRKLLNQQIKNARKESRHDACLLCGKKGGFCNSHTIPQFCLENIAWNGTLNSINTLIDSELLVNESGVNNAGTFHIICKPCDGKVFQDYEKEAAFATCPTEKALNQIALKTSLRDIYKHETALLRLFQLVYSKCKRLCNPYGLHSLLHYFNPSRISWASATLQTLYSQSHPLPSIKVAVVPLLCVNFSVHSPCDQEMVIPVEKSPV